MKTIVAIMLTMSCTTASAWQQFNATTIGPNGPQFTFGQVYGGGRVQQFNTTTIRPGGGVDFGFGNIYGNREAYREAYRETYRGNEPWRARSLYRQMLLGDD